MYNVVTANFSYKYRWMLSDISFYNKDPTSNGQSKQWKHEQRMKSAQS